MKFDFTIPKKSEIILLDDNIANLKFKNLNYLYIDSKKINFFILCKTLLKLFLSKNNLNLRQLYKKNLYQYISPKIAISHHINKRGFECKTLCPEIKVIVYQFSYFHEHKPINSAIDQDWNFDYFLSWCNKDKIYFSNKNKNKIIASGSIRNNSTIGPKNSLKKKYKLMLISEYDPVDVNKKSYLMNNLRKFYKIIDQFCIKFNITLMVALRSKRHDKKFKIESEKKYFNEIMRCNKIFDENYKNSYITANNSEMVACYHSTLGFELLSKKIKVFFLPLHERKFKKTYHLEKEDNFHIHRKIEKKKIFKKMHSLLYISQKNWERKISKKNYLIKHDLKNKVLNNLIKKILKYNFK